MCDMCACENLKSTLLKLPPPAFSHRDSTPSFIPGLAAKSFLSAWKHTHVYSKRHILALTPCSFLITDFRFLSIPLQASGMNQLSMSSPSSQLPPPPQSTAVWFSPLLEEPLSRSPVTSNSSESSKAFQSVKLIISCLPALPQRASFLVSRPPLWLFLLSPLWPFGHQAQAFSISIPLHPFIVPIDWFM